MKSGYLTKKTLILSVVLAAALGLQISSLADDAPATQPAKISPDAKALLDQVSKAYAGAHTLSITGTLDANLSVDDQKSNQHEEFTGLLLPGNKFRSQMNGDVLLGNNGEKVYYFEIAKNRYAEFDLPDGGVNLSTLDSDVADVVRNQDLSLALALSPDAAKELRTNANSIDKAPDVTIDGKAYPALTISRNGMDVTLAFDPDSHLLVRQIDDATKKFKAEGAGVVKSALFTINYKTDTSSTIDPKQLAWAPPAGAQEIGTNSSLEGKPAPTFELADLSGKRVSSKSLDGKVYVMDFWATWCGPCMALLPDMDALHQETQSKGVMMYAIDEQEEKPVIQKTVNDLKLTIPVLLDTDGSLFNKFSQDGIPLTVLVGKDGKVRKVYLGSGHERELKQQIEAALAEK